nr:hypothetical protein Iba_chr11dCG13770 [Ipomoea batatas]GMD98996.1 hypothetical protein Iba_scaffold1668896CG0010 [Ipomoea batatas]GME11176.1 hypothetical protein Iba_scaffold11380CG0120 [Ipomoea batatas]
MLLLYRSLTRMLDSFQWHMWCGKLEVVSQKMQSWILLASRWLHTRG